LDAPFDAQHLLECVFVTVLHLELLPLLPESGVHTRVAELASMAVDRSRTVDFAQSPFHLCELDAHARGFLVRQGSDGTLVNLASRSEAEVGCRFCDVELEHGGLVFIGHSTSGPLVDAHSVPRETTLFFESAVHEVESLGEFGWAVLDGLFEKISETFDADLAVDGFCEV
jgi:hypothetical protein